MLKDCLINSYGCLWLLLLFIPFTAGIHFNGGTITWAPVNPASNASSVSITITQTYSWSYPNIQCINPVPIATPGRSGENNNLTCVVDCSTDGGYSLKPVSILTDCISASSYLGMLTSQRSVNVTLGANASFSVAYQGSAWRSVGSPSTGGLYWSILTSINLRKRPDGLINTPPVANVVSPQYAVVNTPTQIQIPVSDVNAGDDIRCRWSVIQPGTRRRRHQAEEEEILVQRVKRGDKKKKCTDQDCKTSCKKDCDCNCPTCANTNCRRYGNDQCESEPFCPSLITTTKTTRITTTGGTTTATPATTSETPGTIPPTSSFPHRQAVDECGGICYPSRTPAGTTLSNCTLNFTGLVADAWYAVAVQVEDFIDSSSNVSMSSVPVQFLIHVLPLPLCPVPPDFSVSSRCFDAQIGVPMNFTIHIINSCDPDDANISVIIVSQSIPGVTASALTQAADKTYAWIDYSWTPQTNQQGSQQFCVIAFTRSLSLFLSCLGVIRCSSVTN